MSEKNRSIRLAAIEAFVTLSVPCICPRFCCEDPANLSTIVLDHAVAPNCGESTQSLAQVSRPDRRFAACAGPLAEQASGRHELVRAGGLAFRRRLLNYCAAAIHWPAA